jgi:intracellular septation protein
MTSKPTPPAADSVKPQLIRIGLEIGPLIIFFLATTYGEGLLDRFAVLKSLFASPIIFATAPFMVAMLVSLVISWVVFRRVAIMPLVTAIVVVIFGSLTLYFQNGLFIKIKPTIVNSLFGLMLLGGLVFRQSLLKYVFGEVYHLKPEGWRALTIRWGLFFFVLALLNEVAWRGAGALYATPAEADKFYAAFKIWGVVPFTLIFSMLQLPLLQKYALDPDEPVEVVPPMDPLP